MVLQEAEKAAAAQQAWIAATMAVAAPQEAPASAPEPPAADAMVVDAPDTVTQPDKKRKADESGGPDAFKRAKLGSS